VTIILLPLGIPLLGLARRLMTTGVRLMLPRSVAHPVKQSRKRLRGRRAELQDRVANAAADTAKKGKRGKKSAKAMVSKVATSTTHGRRTLRKRFS
jgi:N-acetylglutamate synthase/N-acetylornithine aminotransferase